MNLWKDIPITAFVHGTVWAMPLTSGGLHNLLTVAVWAYAVFIVVAALAALVGIQPKAQMPAWWSWATRLSAVGSMLWLIYQGQIAAGSVMLFAALTLLLARKAHAANQQQEA